jgi:hypothetical protein
VAKTLPEGLVVSAIAQVQTAKKSPADPAGEVFRLGRSIACHNAQAWIVLRRLPTRSGAHVGPLATVAAKKAEVTFGTALGQNTVPRATKPSCTLQRKTLRISTLNLFNQTVK